MKTIFKFSLLAVAVSSLMSFAAHYDNEIDTSVDLNQQKSELTRAISSTSRKPSKSVSVKTQKTNDIHQASAPLMLHKNHQLQTPVLIEDPEDPEDPETPEINYDYTYQLGAGIADITGEVAEANMFGYANGSQISSGVQQRLHARAFLIGDSGKEVLMIVLEAGMVSQALHQDLLERLQETYGNRFTKDNVVLTATHTHAGPGGFSHYLLYGITTRGFQKATFDAILSGALRATDRAVKSQGPGSLRFGTTQLTNASVQRSRTAFVNNPEASSNPGATDTLMQVLKFVKDGKDFASMNWFAVHPTSLTTKNTLVSGDNKGYAAWYWEKSRGMDYLTGKGYIAAFANSNPGDISPNLNLRPGSGPTEDEWQNAKILGQRQADAAMNTVTDTKVHGDIDYRQKYVDYSKVKIDPKYTVDGKPHVTCPAAYKTAFAAGSTEDGGGGDALVASHLVDEGQDNPFIKAIGYTLSWPSRKLIECHGTDQVSIVMGTAKPYPMSPEVLPTQILRVGNLAIISLPSEFTITSGQRIRKQVAKRLNLPYEQVIFAGYSNAYAGYIATPEEYKQQDYEGASTHFGPHTQEAWLQSVDQITEAMVNHKPVESKLKPRKLGRFQLSVAPGVVYDGKPSKANFGDVTVQPKASYRRGERADAVFWSAHPKSGLAYELELTKSNKRDTEPYTMAVQYKDGDKWVDIATDNDWNTTNQWKRISTAQSQATLTWDIPDDAKLGEYRFYHKSAYKSAFSHKLKPFEGVSKSFIVK